ncbi:Ribosomal protein L11 methyltransferase [gamma proteobacterium IMCC2047]|nr:Ribosomal protein L11 methyltransferase [gamma proteobacterium IMCC2047]
MLDPGMAFGTGTHATTALCLQWLDAHSPQGLSVIDYGCGSGVLGIAALLLGCDSMCGIDIDPQALIATHQNAEQNGISKNQYRVFLPAQAPHESADMVLANILAGPLMSLADDISSRVKPGGKLVLSGILSSQAQNVIDAYAQDFDFEPIAEQDGWVRLAGTKHL